MHSWAKYDHSTDVLFWAQTLLNVNYYYIFIRFDYFCSSVRRKEDYSVTITNNSETFENNVGLSIIRIHGNYIYTHSLEGCTYPTIYTNKCRHLANVLE